MNNRLKISLQIGFFVFILGIIFFIISLYLYQDYTSIKLFFNEILNRELNIYLFITVLFLGFLSVIFSYFLMNKIFLNIEKYNNKLKDYNHYLAHELKTPISVINSNLEVLEYGFDKNKITESKKELKDIINIINGLLNFSESFNDVEKKELNIEKFLKSIISFSSLGNNIKIINNEFNLSIETDEVLFERVIKNLIDNALKYSPNKELIIYIKEDKLVFENNIYKQLKKKDLDKVCDKFYTKTCNKNVGYGLGLPMIKEIVNVLGYSLVVNCTEEKFVVEIIYN